jgi:hypothetical protein
LTAMCDLHLEGRDPKLGRDTPPCHDTRIVMKFRQIIFSGSEVTVRTNDKCDVRTYGRTDVTEPNTIIAPPFGAGAKNIVLP